MRLRMVPVQAKNAEEAALKGAKKLEASQNEVSVASISEGRFEVSLAHCNAEIELEISPDKMTATILRGLPAVGKGRPIDGPRLMEILRNAGVHIPPATEVAKKMLKTMARGYEVSNVIIAQGQPPERAKDAKVVPLGDWNYPVFPNDGFGRLEAATFAKPGTNLEGNAIPAGGPERGKSMNFLEKGGCFFDQSSLIVRSDRYGLVVQNGQDMYISSAGMLTISDDRMEVQATIYPKDFRGNRISVERMVTALEAEGISGDVNHKSILEGIGHSEAQGKRIKDVVVCRGVPPKDGEDGWFEMLYKESRSDLGVMDEETGRIDFRARGIVRSVKKGEVIGQLHPPQQGQPGRDVYGKIIHAREGRPFNLQLSGNVDADESGNMFHASEDGMVFFVGNTLSVTDVFTTRGDVNMSCGNIDLEKGSVHVKGAVLSGFSVTSPGNILVNDVIESATVKAAGDIEVRGGIIMDKGGGKVSAKGGVSALFAKNATITAGGDVNVAHELVNCIVFAGNMVYAKKGRGKIIGSTVRAGKGVEANEIGSELGVETTIFLGIERRSFSEEMATKKQYQQVLQRIYASLGTGDPKEILLNAPADKRQAIASLLKARLRAEQKIKDIESEIEQERARIRKAAKARVKVHKTIHPGTIVNCFGVTLRITEPVNYSQVYYDPQEQKVVVASL